MCHCEMRLHVAEPGIYVGESGHSLIQDIFVLLVDQFRPLAADLARVYSDSLLPLIATEI